MILIKGLIQGSADVNSSSQPVTSPDRVVEPWLEMFRRNFKSSNNRLGRIIDFCRFSNRFYWSMIRPIRARVGHFENQPIDNIAVVSLSAAKRNRIASAFQWFRMSHCNYESEIMTHNLWRINFGTVTNEDCKKRVGLLLSTEKVF